MAEEKIKLTPELELVPQFTFGGALWLEEQFGKPIAEIDFYKGGLPTVMKIITAIAISNYPEKSVEELQAKIAAVPLTKFEPLMKAMGKMLGGLPAQRKKKVTKNG
ncbi:MAG: hypothetical protein ACYSSI_02645 [Planctomycetota bacterium]|jgi:hypothetical protein